MFAKRFCAGSRFTKGIVTFAGAMLALIAPCIVFAGSATLTWTAPTQNEDGTPLTNLEKYTIYSGCQTSGQYERTPIDVDGSLLNLTVNDLPEGGNCYFVATAWNTSGTESRYSGEAIKIIAGTGQLSGPVENLQITWQESTAIYSLPSTNFTGSPIQAGTWSVTGEALTIDFEITPRTRPLSDTRIISKATSTAEQDHFFMVSFHGAGTLRFRLKTNGTTKTLYGSAIIPMNQTTVGRVTYDGALMRIFVNGALDASTAKTGPMDAGSAPVWVGGNPPNNYGPFDGFIAVTVN